MDTNSIYQELTLIQGCITRMAWNAWILKTFAIAVFDVAFFIHAPVMVIPMFAFWGLDAYFLRLERMYRELYDLMRRARLNDVTDGLFCCTPIASESHVDPWWKTVLSKTLVPFYASMISLMIVMWFV